MDDDYRLAGWKEASLGATPRVISGVNVSDGYLWGSGGSSYSHSSSGVSRQKHVDNGPSGYQGGSVKRHVAR